MFIVYISGKNGEVEFGNLSRKDDETYLKKKGTRNVS